MGSNTRDTTRPNGYKVQGSPPREVGTRMGARRGPWSSLTSCVTVAVLPVLGITRNELTS